MIRLKHILLLLIAVFCMAVSPCAGTEGINIFSPSSTPSGSKATDTDTPASDDSVTADEFTPTDMIPTEEPLVPVGDLPPTDSPSTSPVDIGKTRAGDDEPFASIPVTVAKKYEDIINALRIKGTTRSPDKFDPSKKEIVITGLSGAATYSRTVVAVLPETLEVLSSAVVDNYGTFEIVLDTDYLSQPIYITYYHELNETYSYPVTIVVHSQDNYQVLLYDKQTLPDRQISVTKGYVTYNNRLSDGSHRIRRQVIRGGTPFDIAIANHFYDQLQTLGTSPAIRSEGNVVPSNQQTNVKSKAAASNVGLASVEGSWDIIAVNPVNKAVVHISLLSQFVTLSDDTSINLKQTNILTQPVLGGYVFAQETPSDSNLPGQLKILPLSPQATDPNDLTVIVPGDPSAVERQMTWDHNLNVIATAKYPTTLGDGTKTFDYHLESLTFGNAATFQEFFDLGLVNNNTITVSQKNVLITSADKISNPHASHPMFQLNGDPIPDAEHFIVFECVINSVQQICRYDDQTGMTQLTTGTNNNFNPDLSMFNDFLGYTEVTENGNQHVKFIHLPTGTVFSFTNDDKLSEFKDLYRYNKRVTFSDKYHYGFAYLTSHDNQSFYLAVGNLESHDVISQYVRSLKEMTTTPIQNTNPVDGKTK